MPPEVLLSAVLKSMMEFLRELESHAGVPVTDTPPHACSVCVSETGSPYAYAVSRELPELLQGRDVSEWAPFAAFLAAEFEPPNTGYGYIGCLVESEDLDTALVGVLVSRDGEALCGAYIDLADARAEPEPITNLVSHFPFLLFGVQHDASVQH